MGNFKIVVTAVMFRLIMKKELAGRQWWAVCLLTAGGGINSYTALNASSHVRTEIHLTIQGLVMMLCFCCISGFSSIYNELIFKKDMDTSVYYQNALLYTFGAFLNGCFWCYESFEERGFWREGSGTSSFDMLFIFKGFSKYAWMVVATEVMYGLIMSLIIKHLNSMVKVFVAAAAPLVTTLLAYLVFGLHIPAMFLFSVACVGTAVVLYNV